MAALTKNAISVRVRDRGKQTKFANPKVTVCYCNNKQQHWGLRNKK